MGGAVKVGICVGLLVAVVSGCGAGAGASAPNVHAELLNLGDLPAGWDVDVSTQTATTVPASQQVSGCPAFKTVFGTTTLSETRADARGSFSSDLFGASLSEELGAYSAPSEAIAAYNKLVDENRACRSVSETMANGDAVTITADKDSPPSLGKGSAAFVYDIANPTAKVQAEVGIVVAIRGDQDIVVGYGAGSSSPASGLVRYGRLALEKVH